jgi:hypothetical protein
MWRRTEHKEVYATELLGSWTLSIVRYSRNQKTQCFGSWILFRPQVKDDDTYSVGPLERANLNHWSSEVGPIVTLS